MPKKVVYGLWTNKGGVGKTTLTFHISSSYAAEFPERRVLLLDLCPQANLSSTVLTCLSREETPKKRRRGQNRNILNFQFVKGSTRVKEICGQIVENTPIPKTVMGYLLAVNNPKKNRVIRNVTSYTVQVNQYNPNMPANMHLLCGDSRLEILAPNLIKKATQDSARNNITDNWLEVHWYLKTFIGDWIDEMDKLEGPKETVVFIDTNPALTIYTEVALCAMDRLIVPINADDYSLEAVNSMLHTVFGTTPEQGALAFLEQQSFANQVKCEYDGLSDDMKLRAPKVHMIVHNKANVVNNSAAKIFKSVQIEVIKALYEGYQMNTANFTEVTPDRAVLEPPEDFEVYRYRDLEAINNNDGDGGGDGPEVVEIEVDDDGASTVAAEAVDEEFFEAEDEINGDQMKEYEEFVGHYLHMVRDMVGMGVGAAYFGLRLQQLPDYKTATKRYVERIFDDNRSLRNAKKDINNLVKAL